MTAIAAAKPGQKEYTLWDGTLAHFGVRVQPLGVRSFIVQTRTRGRMRKITLGRFPEMGIERARSMARRRASALDGEDVVAKPFGSPLGGHRRAPYGRLYPHEGEDCHATQDMPANWPPPHFIAGKTLRWEGAHLMEHSGSGEQALYRFDGVDETGYTVSTDEGDNRVTVVKVYAEPVPRYVFEFHADKYGDARQGSGFRAGYGYEKGRRNIYREGHALFINSITPLRAVLGGTTVEYEDALIPTSTSSSSWGAVKRSLVGP